MKSYNRYIGFVLFLIFVVPTAAFAEPTVSLNSKLLTSANEQQQVIKPSKDQQVAVLDIIINASDGVAKDIELRSIKLINSFAPKVYSRQSIEGWKITIKGEKTASFTVNNPLSDIEIENPDNKESPFSMVRPSGPVEWTLIVPLYKDGKLLGAKQIVIQDTKNENIKLSVVLNDK